MTVRYLGESDPLTLLANKDYIVQSIESGWYRIIDEEGVDPEDEVPGYLYPPESFEIISGSPDEYDDEFADE